MKYKSLSGLLLITTLVLQAPAHAKVFKIATIAPDGTNWMQKMRAGAKEIKKQTEGRVMLKFYPGGVMGNDSNVLRKIRINQLQGGAVTTGSLSGIEPDMDIYGLPYLFSSFKEVDYVRAKMDKVLLRNLEKKGFVSFGLAEGGFSYMMSDSPIRSVEDVRKQKVWIPTGQVGEAVFASAGISPVPLPLSDVMTGLQTSLINTVVTSSIGAIALQWHTRIKYVVDVPLTYVSATLVIDKKAFNKIGKKDQKIVRDIMNRTFSEIDKKNRRDNNAAREALKNQGVVFLKLSNEDLAEWHKIGEKAMRKLEEQSKYSEAVYALIMKHIRAARKLP